jgi:hypothetical protein
MAAALVLPLSGNPPGLLVQLGLIPAGQPALPSWAAGLAATLFALGLHLLVFVPVLPATRGPARAFLHTTTELAIAIAGYLALVSVAHLPFPGQRTLTAALQLGLTLPYLLLVLASVESRRAGGSLRAAWRAIGLRTYRGPAVWLALAAAAIAAAPWVLVGSLGSAQTTAANVLQALPNALGEEILFRGLALAWLWRVLSGPGDGGGRTASATSLLLFVAAQAGTALPAGDLGVLPRFAAALALGLLFTELTVRAGGSIWPAVVAHFLYDWFHLAFVDPRSEAEILHGEAQIWATAVLGGIGLLLWLVRTAGSARPPSQARYSAPTEAGGSTAERALAPGRQAAALATAGAAGVAWAVVLVLYLAAGAPGFHPDGLLIYLNEQADLGRAAQIADPAERRAWVVQALVETADRTQATLRAELERRGVRYRPHYLVNAIEILERPGLRRAFAGRQDVASVLFMPGVRPYPRTVSIPGFDPVGANGVEWNVHAVGADRVWAQGFTGESIVVGSADTGVEWDHPALKAAYLGWQGSGPVDHAYHWYDPWDDTPEPFDDIGHGTHTTGTMVGQDGQNRVGLAPGARWIACRNMRHGIGNAGAYIGCMEFLLAPFPPGGDPLHDADPARGAHVVNNSWGCPTEEGCLADSLLIAVDHLRAAGQMMVVSAGNEGPACGTVQDPPAIYASVFSVGAVNQVQWPASFTSRGPVEVDGSGREKPDISAPGVDIRSATPNGYGVESGTSMAGPHVAGAVALLWSARPELIGDLARTEEILERTASPLAVNAAACALPGRAATGAGACPCGADRTGAVPNNVFGWGQVDAWAAFEAAR